MNVRRVRTLVLGLSCVALPAARAQSQEVAAAETPAHARHAADVLMTRLISVRLDRVPLKSAIDVLLSKADAHATYRTELVGTLEKPITLHAEKMPLGTALDAVLNGTGLHAQAIAADLVKIEPVRQESQPGLGILTGRVTDAGTKRPIAGVIVSVDGTRLGATTSADGAS